MQIAAQPHGLPIFQGECESHNRKCVENWNVETSKLKMIVSLEDIKNVKQKYCLGESLKFFLAVTWCDISQGPQLFLYILRQTEKKNRSGTYVPSTRDFLGGMVIMMGSSSIYRRVLGGRGSGAG